MNPTCPPSASNSEINALHQPVMLQDVLEVLSVVSGRLYVDGTFGAGGYTRAVLERGGIVHAFDRDPDVQGIAGQFKAEFGENFAFYPHRFSEMQSVLAGHGITQVDGVMLDIGVSSMQLDRPERGFSFQKDGPLSMSMSQSGETAADFLNTAREEEIADVLWRYGEERRSRQIARAIVAARPLQTTLQLAEIIRKVVHVRPGHKQDPATRSFQAIRIHINDELGELEMALEAARQLLAPGGRLVVVSFHSLEDRIVKTFIRKNASGQAKGSRHQPVLAADNDESSFDRPPKALRASEQEAGINPRSRSATLRVAVKRPINAKKTASGGNEQ